MFVTLQTVCAVWLFLSLTTVSHGASISSSSPKPEVGAYAKDFKGGVTAVYTEQEDSEVTLPHLNVEDNFYFGRTRQLNCTASYPVQWVYRGLGTPQVHTETFRVAPDFMNTDSYIFQASVVFTHTNPAQTGNYSCEGIERPDLRSYLYVYVPDNSTVFILNSSEQHTVYGDLKVNPEWLTLPCMVTDPAVKIQLYKATSNGILVAMNEGPNVEFHPATGYRIRLSNPIGQYVCSADGDHRGEKLKINVKATSENAQTNELPPENPLSLRYDASTHQIICCNNRGVGKPSINAVNCESVSDCNIKNNYLRQKKGPDEHVVPVNGSCVGFELFETREAGILDCYYEDHVVFNQYSKEHDVIITDFNQMPPIQDILELHKEEVTSSSDSTPRNRYVCHANPFYFATGLKMAWERADGSLDFVNETNFPLSNTVEIDATGHNLTKLYCFAPVWNSATEWRNVSVLVN